jgi:hypothetical protein
VRYQHPNEGYDPLGISHFPATLHGNGTIEFRYGAIAEKDGIVGIFGGATGTGKLLHSADFTEPARKHDPHHRARRRVSAAFLDEAPGLSGFARTRLRHHRSQRPRSPLKPCQRRHQSGDARYFHHATNSRLNITIN